MLFKFSLVKERRNELRHGTCSHRQGQDREQVQGRDILESLNESTNISTEVR